MWEIELANFGYLQLNYHWFSANAVYLVQKAAWVKDFLTFTKALFLFQFCIAWSILLNADTLITIAVLWVLSKFHMKCCLISTDFPSSLFSSDLTVKTGQVVGTLRCPWDIIILYNFSICLRKMMIGSQKQVLYGKMKKRILEMKKSALISCT